MSITARVIKNDFPRLAGNLEPKAKAVNSTVAHAIEADAKQAAPIKDGGLRGSIHAEEDGDINYVVTVGVVYGPRIEFGFMDTDSLGRTYHQAAQPYMTPSAERHRQPHIAAMRRIVG